MIARMADMSTISGVLEWASKTPPSLWSAASQEEAAEVVRGLRLLHEYRKHKSRHFTSQIDLCDQQIDFWKAADKAIGDVPA